MKHRIFNDRFTIKCRAALVIGSLMVAAPMPWIAQTYGQSQQELTVMPPVNISPPSLSTAVIKPTPPPLQHHHAKRRGIPLPPLHDCMATEMAAPYDRSVECDARIDIFCRTANTGDPDDQPSDGAYHHRLSACFGLGGRCIPTYERLCDQG